MKTVKIIIAIFLAMIIYGNFRMLADGDFESGWDYFALLVFIILEILLLSSIARTKQDQEDEK